MNVLRTIDSKKYYDTEPNITRVLVTKPAIALLDEPSLSTTACRLGRQNQDVRKN